MDVTITGLTSHGDGSVIVDGRTIAVPGAAPGDQVAMDDLANLMNVKMPGPNRQDPPCPHFSACGGCSAQHLAPEYYAAWKRSKIVDALVRRTAMNTTNAESLVAAIMPAAPGGRRRADLAAEKTKTGVALGFHHRASTKIENIENCLVLRPALNSILQSLKMLLDGIMTRGQRLDIHLTECVNGIDATFSAIAGFGGQPPNATMTEQLAKFAEANGIARISWRMSNERQAAPIPVILREPPIVRFAGADIDFPPASFLQASAATETAITGAVMACLKHVCQSLGKKRRETAPLAGLTVADLYSGLGTLSLPVARAGAKVTAYDIDGPATEALAAAASRYGAPLTIQPRNLYSQPLSARELTGVDVLIADPPYNHEWVGPMKFETIDAARLPTAIVYVSCDPETFAIGAGKLATAGYKLRRVIPIDQFIYTRHLELVGLFEKRQATSQ